MREKFILSFKFPSALAEGKKECQYHQALAKICLLQPHPDYLLCHNPIGVLNLFRERAKATFQLIVILIPELF
jgi:hypothetical protein